MENAVLSTVPTKSERISVLFGDRRVRGKWLLKRWAQSRNALHNILGSAKFAYRSRVCSWLPTSIRQKTKRSIARLVRKTGRYKLFFNLPSVFKKQRDQHVAQSVFLKETASD